MAEYAVLIPWVTTEQGEMLLLEVRSEYVRQPGEICFPGGRIEKGETPAETAVRETCEELGLRPEAVKVSGDPVTEVTSDGRVVYSVPARICRESLEELRLSHQEVAEVFLLPLEWLRDNPARRFDLGITPEEELPRELSRYLSHYTHYRWPYSTYYWEYEGHGIWGLTARIIMDVLEG